MLLLGFVNCGLDVGPRLLTGVVNARILMRHRAIVGAAWGKRWIHHESLVKRLVPRRGTLVEGPLLTHRFEHRILHEPRGVDLVGPWPGIFFRRRLENAVTLTPGFVGCVKLWSLVKVAIVLHYILAVDASIVSEVVTLVC